ncbi:MAG: hypothetical protein ACLSGB_06130 [Dorea sp.]
MHGSFSDLPTSGSHPQILNSSRVDQKKSGTIASNNLVNSGYQFSETAMEIRKSDVTDRHWESLERQGFIRFSVHRNYKREDTKNARCSP